MRGKNDRRRAFIFTVRTAAAVRGKDVRFASTSRRRAPAGPEKQKRHESAAGAVIQAKSRC